ncbi:unnamed protein product [Thelazia callipaeda]|uniref:Nucleoporin NDC1 n=1 Tax=Thelazia callipaeda TaxID=103827 RepID=A0A0N5D4N2_THECL|nr:unnamed protein product [Thelazia callipaeda]
MSRAFNVYDGCSLLSSSSANERQQQRKMFSPIGLLNEDYVTAPESISQWFRRIVFFRIMGACASFSIYCMVVYFIAVCVLQASLFHPIQAFIDCYLLLFSLRSSFYAVLFALLSATHTALFGLFVLRFNNEDRLSFRSVRSWLIYILSLNIALSQFGCLLIGSYAHEFSRFFFFMLIITQAAATFHEIFHTSYRLVFPVIEMRPSMQLSSILLPTTKDILYNKIPRIFKWTALHSLIFGLPIIGWSLFRSLFDISLYFNIFVLLSVYLVLHKVSIGLIKIFLLQTCEFTMPLPFTTLNPPSEVHGTLLAALELTGMIKAFAFWDLRTLSAACHHRRQIIFSLSQPGGHPRNWNAVQSSCHNQIKYLSSLFENENDRIRSEAFANVAAPLLPASDGKRPAILFQTAWLKDNVRQRMLSKNLRKESSSSTSWLKDYLPPFMDKLKLLMNSNRHVVSLFDVYIGILAIESLSALVCVSLNEDRFGVVQKDLRQIVSVFLHLCSNLERYMRSSKEDREWQNRACVPLHASITMALNRIRLTFSEGTISKLLSPQEAIYFKKVTSFD